MSVDMHVQFDHHSKISEVDLGKTLLFCNVCGNQGCLRISLTTRFTNLAACSYDLMQADLDRESLACRNRNFLRRSSKSKPAKKGFEWCNNFRSKPFLRLVVQR